MTLPIDLTTNKEAKTTFRVRLNSIRDKMIDMGFSTKDIRTKSDKLLKSCELQPNERLYQYHARVSLILDDCLEEISITTPRLDLNELFRFREGR